MDKMKPLTKKEQTAIKRGITDLAIVAAMHILHDSHLNGSELWPKKGMFAGWGFEDWDTVYVGARIFDDHNLLRVNIWDQDLERIREQIDAFDMVLDQATYDNIFFTAYHHGLNTSGLGMLDFKFTITT